MPDSSGIGDAAGKPLSDFAHVAQSVRKILSTRIGSRVMRRDFGSEVPELIDRRMTQRNILAVYAAAAVAIERWEPRFRLTQASITDANASGQISLTLRGTYYPRGHLGDMTPAPDTYTINWQLVA